MPPFAKSVTVFLIASLAATGLITSPTAAEAATSGVVRSAKSVTTSFWSSELKTCFVFTVSGTVASNWKVGAGSMGGRRYWMTDPSITSPKMKVKTYNKCGKGRKAKTVTGIEFTQDYYEYSCQIVTTYGIDISKAGLSVGVSATPTCGTTAIASKTATYLKTKSSSFTSSNTGAVVTWHSVVWRQMGATKNPPVSVCVTPFGSFRGYQVKKGKGHDDGGPITFPSMCLNFPPQ